MEYKSNFKMDSDYMGMISEDHSAPSNLPQGVVHKYYPKCEYLGGYEIDDTSRGLDDTRNYDIKLTEKNMSESKY